ncbi:MAG: hypothetical protein V4538_16320 [Bacteroidota bacterium]
MAQSIAYWQNKMLTAIAGDSKLSAMNSVSQVAIYRLLTFIVATCINIFEQTLDIFKIEMEGIADEAAPGTNKWIQNEVFKFQYSTTTPQVVTLVDLIPTYAVIDESLQIITRCYVKTMSNKVVSVKVAKGEPPEALDSLEKTSLTGYLNVGGFAGVLPSIISLPPDKLYLVADIYFDGNYAAIIKTNVIAGINAFLSKLSSVDSFDGIVRVSALESAILAVGGVTDIAIKDMAIRADATAFVDKTFIVQDYDLLFNKYPTTAGYIVEETTSGEDFLTKLNFIPES